MIDWLTFQVAGFENTRIDEHALHMGVTPRGIVLSRFALDYIKHAEQGGVIPKLLESSRTRFVSFLKETRRQSASGDR